MIQYVPSTPACVELNHSVMTQVANGQVAEAEAALAKVLASSADHAQISCGGFILNNMAATTAALGRVGEAERLAERSLKVLEGIYPPDDAMLLRPLQILAATRFEQGKRAKAREVFKRMQVTRVQSPEDRALVHGMAGSFLQSEGKRREAEVEFLAAFRAWVAAGREETGDAASILACLGSLYIEEHRLDEARGMLDRAETIFSNASDAVPMDRIKLLQLRASLHTRQGNWQGAEQDLSEALSIADRQSKIDSIALRSLLTGYAAVLRKNHRGREAHTIDARLAALGPDLNRQVVDVTDLLAKSGHVK